MTPDERAEVRREHLMEDARQAMQAEADWQRHEALHEPENADPESCWICREQLDTFLRFGETLTDDMARKHTPDPSWVAGPDGYVRTPLVNEGTR